MALAPFPLAPPTSHPFFHLCPPGGTACTSHSSRRPPEQQPLCTPLFLSLTYALMGHTEVPEQRKGDHACIGGNQTWHLCYFHSQEQHPKVSPAQTERGRAPSARQCPRRNAQICRDFMSFFEPNWSKVSHAPREWQLCSFFYASEVKEGRRHEVGKPGGDSSQESWDHCSLEGASLLQSCVTLDARGQCTRLLQAKITLCYRSSRPGA